MFNDYTPRWDDVVVECDSSSESDHEPAAPYNPRNIHLWLDDHFDILQELYKVFLSNGKLAFGQAFCQFASFSEFADYIHRHTIP
jgi:hypothetical protein